MFVKPASGGMIRWPRTFALLHEDGEHVPPDAFWMRALSQGCVVEAEPPPAVPAEQSDGKSDAPARPDVEQEHAS